MRFGFALPNHWGVEDPEDLLDLASRAERAGFASVWVAHHILNAGYVGERLGMKPYWDALTVLGWVAARTERVRLGTSVLVLPYLHPMPLAKQLATIDVLSGGRLDLGVGVGAMPEENEALGVDYHTRGAQADECIDVLKALWADGSASYAGAHYAFEDAASSPKPLQRPHPPLLIGGNGIPALRRVARSGDGWHPFLLTAQQMEQRLPRLDEELARAGRSRDEISVSLRVEMDTVPTREAAEVFAALGIDELVIALNSGDADEQRRRLDQAASALL
ncbi:MAG: TIGR03619 family F420-dependent LLM class oxidoreductase [Chloroflexota bacterium]|nr:TIGR03619 family F420-dependent LLM class oxidoreductase [Chloroflexota bacterium]